MATSPKFLEKVRLAPIVVAKVQALLKEYPEDEWTLMGRRAGPDDPLTCIDVICPPQTNDGSSTVLDKEAWGSLQMDILEGKMPGWKIEDIVFWIHSHNTMGVFWSSTDNACVVEFGRAEDRDGYLASIVFNNKFDSRCRVDMFNPSHITFDDIGWSPVVTDNWLQASQKLIANMELEELKGWMEAYFKDSKPHLSARIEVPLPDVSSWLENAKKGITVKPAPVRMLHAAQGRGLASWGSKENPTRGTHRKSEIGLHGYWGYTPDDNDDVEEDTVYGQFLKEGEEEEGGATGETYIAAAEALTLKCRFFSVPVDLAMQEFDALIAAGSEIDSAYAEVLSGIDYCWASLRSEEAL